MYIVYTLYIEVMCLYYIAYCIVHIIYIYICIYIYIYIYIYMCVCGVCGVLNTCVVSETLL